MDVSAVLFGNKMDGAAAELFAYGADKVYLADDPSLEGFTDDLYGSLLTDLIREHRPEIVLCGGHVPGAVLFSQGGRRPEHGFDGGLHRSGHPG